MKKAKGIVDYRTLPTWGILVLALLGFVAYHMPWHLHELAAFSNNAFDLAEWMSLHPAVRQAQIEETPLLTVWFLRFIPLLLAAIIVLNAPLLKDERWRWLWRGIAILIVLRLNPPIDFYRSLSPTLSDRSLDNILVLGWLDSTAVDANNAMLGNLMFTGLLILGIIILSSRWLKMIASPLTLATCIYALYIADRGYDGATEAIRLLQIELDTGGGYILFRWFLYGVMLLTVGRFIRDVYPWLRRLRSTEISGITLTSTSTP